MLQYAVDTQLDELLARLFRALTEPPLALNPYPKLVHMIRVHAARLDLWRDDIPEMRSCTLNSLTLLQPPTFIYEAQPPPARAHAAGWTHQRARGGRRGGGGPVGRGVGDAEEDEYDESTATFGCYAAVTLCDCRPSNP
ncbi:hypothetical protein MNEG_8111 [Monoraphidium neglectum]|uniref:Uncharacterized protein n=1 Tax=Monoraphidium neglectum TaxID=145388 RepID=A0A0D2KX29_9CHLO|nr:hypothetical protein MNEG_8111 [Monoraphidium neglectum]KIY99848.1 hypothetical protein MNEG_8111 [Monoraphidium neglectum]|eukprot:XP_013898868.1 hypothetical protein MNEG_8111 [Monoraphidium neglectum]